MPLCGEHTAVMGTQNGQPMIACPQHRSRIRQMLFIFVSAVIILVIVMVTKAFWHSK
jgi:hypothetical protein